MMCARKRALRLCTQTITFVTRSHFGSSLFREGGCRPGRRAWPEFLSPVITRVCCGAMSGLMGSAARSSFVMSLHRRGRTFRGRCRRNERGSAALFSISFVFRRASSVLCSGAGTTRIIGDGGDAEKELDGREIVEDIEKAEEKIADAEKTDDKVADADKDAQLKKWVALIRMIVSHCTAASLIFTDSGGTDMSTIENIFADRSARTLSSRASSLIMYARWKLPTVTRSEVFGNTRGGLL